VCRAAGNVQPQPKVGPFCEELDRLLEENNRRPRRERLTLVRVYEELCNQGYDGGYDALRRVALRRRCRSSVCYRRGARRWKQRETEISSAAFVPPGLVATRNVWRGIPVRPLRSARSHEIMVVGADERAFGRGKATYDPLHYVPVLTRNRCTTHHGAVRNGVPFKEGSCPLR